MPPAAPLAAPLANSGAVANTGALAHLLSVDVEDYFQVEAFADRVAAADWENYPSRVEANTRRVLELFARRGARATFFFVGWVAERCPALVRDVVQAGHELGCHSYWHRPVYKLAPDEFRADTRRARSVIEQAGGAPVAGYRAPTWSITRACPWALDILAEEGFAYDSSIYPVHHDLYGIPGARRHSYFHAAAGGRRLLEIPPTTLRWLGVTMPAAGGGYLRVLPPWHARWALRRATASGEPGVVYLHPWEVDPGQPRLRGRARSRFRHYTGLRAMERRLDQLLTRFRFQTMGEFARARLAAAELKSAAH